MSKNLRALAATACYQVVDQGKSLSDVLQKAQQELSGEHMYEPQQQNFHLSVPYVIDEQFHLEQIRLLLPFYGMPLAHASLSMSLWWHPLKKDLLTSNQMH